MATASKAVPADVIDDDPFDSPGSGEFINWETLNGELLVFVPKRFEPHIQTINTKAGEQSPCVVTDVYVLTGDDSKDEDGAALPLGKLYEDQMVFQAFQHRLKGKLPEDDKHRFVLARLGQGPKQPGRNKPWILIDVKDVPADMVIARAWMAAFKAEQEARKAAADPF
jgi:hypothetical protein